MENDAEDRIIRLYSRLLALRRNVPEEIQVHEKYGKEYNDAVDDFENELGTDLDEFRMPLREFKTIVAKKTPTTTSYTKEKYLERAFLLTKLDSLIAYIEVKYLAPEQRNIGFAP